VTTAAILTYLREHPEEAFAVVDALGDIAGPWTCRRSGSGWAWFRRTPNTVSGSQAFQGAPATVEALARADAHLVARGVLLAGGLPCGADAERHLVPECGEVHRMTQGRPRLARDSDPRRELACMHPRGHLTACGALSPPEWLPGERMSPEDRARPLGWWTASNAVERGDR
jgi:hypothetical protein